MDKTNTLHIILKTLMHYKNKRAVDIVNDTSIPRPTIYKIVTGETKNPQYKYLEILANYFTVSVEQLKGLDPICWDNFPTFKSNFLKRAKQIPVYLWEKENEWKNEFLASKEKRYVVTDKNVNDKKTFALEVKDYSMSPLFNKGAIIIVDPDISPKSGSYIIAKIQNVEQVVFRQLIVDIDIKYLNPLNTNSDLFKKRILNKNDLILGVVIQALIDFEYE